jgi:hypothetical protein
MCAIGWMRCVCEQKKKLFRVVYLMSVKYSIMRALYTHTDKKRLRVRCEYDRGKKYKGEKYYTTTTTKREYTYRIQFFSFVFRVTICRT